IWKELLYSFHDPVWRIEASAVLERLESKAYAKKTDDQLTTLEGLSENRKDDFAVFYLRGLVVAAKERHTAGDFDGAKKLFTRAFAVAESFPAIRIENHPKIPTQGPYLNYIAGQQIALGLLEDAQMTVVSCS